MSVRSVTVVILGTEGRDEVPEALGRMVPVPSARDEGFRSVVARGRFWFVRCDGSVISRDVVVDGSSWNSSPLNILMMPFVSHSVDVLPRSTERGVSPGGGCRSGASGLDFVRSISPTLALLRRALEVEPFPREWPWGLMVRSGPGEDASACSISSSLPLMLLGLVGRGLE